MIVRCPEDNYALVAAEALADADGDPFLGTTIAGRYVVLARVGAGSMGTVYRARQEAMRRDVALKILRSDRALDAQAKARFTREARAMSLLTSPHTVTVFDFGEIPEPPPRPGEFASGGASLYLAMEMLDGESLGQRLKRLRRVRVDDAVIITRQALLSLAEAHDKGVIHRDLKPDNLFLTKAPSGDVTDLCKVLDFGIAKLVTDNLHVDALETQAGTVFGTPRYMSPEQAQGKALDSRSDLYALGVLLYQMLVGRPPFVDDDAVVVMARHIKTIPVPPLDAAPDLGIPRALSDLVIRALAKDPKDRPPSAREFIAELDRAMAIAMGVVVSRPPSTALVSGEMAAVVRDDSVRRLGSRRSKAMLVIAVATAGVTLAGGLITARALRPTPSASTTTAQRVLARTVLAYLQPVAPATSAASEEPSGTAVAPDAASPTAPTPVTAAPPMARPRGAASSRIPKKTPYTRFE
jgi:serine/threonine-protein kinase